MQFADCALRGVRLQENAVGRRGAPRIGRHRGLDRLLPGRLRLPPSLPGRLGISRQARASQGGAPPGERGPQRAAASCSPLSPLSSRCQGQRERSGLICRVTRVAPPAASGGQEGVTGASVRGHARRSEALRAAKPCRMSTCFKCRARSHRPRSKEHRRRAEKGGWSPRAAASVAAAAHPPALRSPKQSVFTPRTFLQQRPRGRGGFVCHPPARPWGVVLVRGGTLSWGSFARRTSSAV